ncbi:hypothetical protein [Herbaspirillum lusitanum]|uniref:hypothetical protein n=1 Tax=Herbaspirillum lusitanum TaxID=213312 RepID=UPI0012F4EB60|nr:hypothetical protein [Herbaspirillum lusitanum]
MTNEQFEHKGQQVEIKMVQPLIGGWLWQTDINGVRIASSRRAPIKYRQDALQYAVLEAKEFIDMESTGRP